MQIFVSLPGKTLTLDVETSDTIDDVKAKIQDKTRTTPDEMKLIFNTTLLEEGEQFDVAHYGIDSESTLHMISYSKLASCLALKDLQGSILQGFQKFFYIRGYHLDNFLDEVVNALQRCEFTSKYALVVKNRVTQLFKDHLTTTVRHYVQKLQKELIHVLSETIDSMGLSYQPVIGKSAVILFIGLSGSGKTSACENYALYLHEAGFNPAVVYANNLSNEEMNTRDQTIPYLATGSDTSSIQTDVKKFISDQHDVILIESCGRDDINSVYEETDRICKALKIKLIVLVVDASYGKFSGPIIKKIARKYENSAFIVSKMDTYPHGMGVLGRIGEYEGAVLGIGTGDKEFCKFEGYIFVRALMNKESYAYEFIRVLETLPSEFEELEIVDDFENLREIVDYLKTWKMFFAANVENMETIKRYLGTGIANLVITRWAPKENIKLMKKFAASNRMTVEDWVWDF